VNDERAAEGLDHLQAAALEMISAARAFLDVMEEVVVDPDSVASVVSAVGSVAQGAARAARAGATGSPTTDPPGAGDPDDGPVQHIRVS
jgi:hypothetical protein